MEAYLLESVTIESPHVYFGTLRLLAVRPTIVHPNHVTISVYDVNGAQRLSIQIASKHVCKALLCQSGQQKAIAFLVNRFCAHKIRETLQISTIPEATIGNGAPYFDCESARICQRYILVDITKFNSTDMDLLRRVLRVTEEMKLLLKAQNIAQGLVVNTSSEAFLENMDENDFVNLMRDIGFYGEQISGRMPNLATRLIGNNNTSRVASVAAAPSHPSQGIIRAPNVQRIRNVAYCQSYGSRIIQQRPVTVNIVRVVPYQDLSSPLVSSPCTHVADGRNTVIPTTLSRNKHIVGGVPSKKVSVVTQTNVQERIVKQPISVSQPIYTASEPSTSRLGILKTEGKNLSQSGKRVVHIIDDDDESSSVPPMKEPRLDLLLNYPRDQPNSISVHYADVEYLRPNEMLNDTIIEFYLKYIQMELIPPEKRSSVFIFNPFFYSRLTQMPSAGPSVIRTVSSRAKWIAENYKGLRTWTKNVDIFKADYIVVPIVEDIHWYLAIITFPRYAIMNREGEAGNDNDDDDDDDNDEDESIIPKKLRKARIIILDSLADAADVKRKLTFPVLREYLICEYEDKRKKKDRDTKYIAKERIEKIVPFPVPQQRNYTDCGLFLLKFAECFLLKPPIFMTRNDSFQRWYPNFTIKGMRRSILAKLKSACDEEAWRAYEEYSRKCDVNSQSIEVALPEQSSKDRSPSPVLRRRTLSTGDHNVDMRAYSKRRRSLPARLPSC